MKFLLFLTILLFATGCVTQSPAPTAAGDFVLHNVNIVDVENRHIIRDQSILVRDGLIVQLLPSETTVAETGIKVIDGAGGFVTAGLIDMHVHMYEPAAYSIALSHGVTHVRVMNGVKAQLAWRDAVSKGELIGASSTVSSPIISAYDDAPLHHAVHTADAARSAVRQYHAEGYDLIKAYGSLTAEPLLALVQEAQKLNLPVAKHGPHASGDLPVSVLTGLQSFEHVEDIYQGPLNHQFAPELLPPVIAELKATQVPISATLNIFNQLTQLSKQKQGFLAQIPEDYTSDIIAFESKHNQLERWLTASEEMAAHNVKTLQFLIDITAQLHQQQVPLLVGSDSGVLLSPHGLATHTEMALLQESGLDAFDVLAAATVNPARALQLEQQIGKVAEGYKADFIYSKQNPLQNLTVLEWPDAVSKRGNWYSAEQLKTLRQQAIESRSFWDELQVLWPAL